MKIVSTESFEHDAETRGNLWRWTGMLLPPIAWAVQLQTIYLTSEDGCFDHDFKWNHVVSVAALLVAAAGGLIAWGMWPAAGDYETTKEEGRVAVRKRFMSIAGLALTILFAVLIFAQWLPTLTGVPCNK